MSREPLKDTRLKFCQQVLPPYIFSFSVSLSLPTFISSPSLPLHPMNTLQPMNIPSEPDHSEWSRNLRWLNFLASVLHEADFSAWPCALLYWLGILPLVPCVSAHGAQGAQMMLTNTADRGWKSPCVLVDPCTLHQRAQGSWPSGRWCPPAIHVLETSHSLSTQPLAEWAPGATVRAILELATKGSMLLPEGSNLHLYLSP